MNNTRGYMGQYINFMGIQPFNHPGGGWWLRFALSINSQDWEGQPLMLLTWLPCVGMIPRAVVRSFAHCPTEHAKKSWGASIAFVAQEVVWCRQEGEACQVLWSVSTRMCTMWAVEVKPIGTSTCKGDFLLWILMIHYHPTSYNIV